MRFIGNVEGRDVMSDAVDVVVTDGFTGNVVLKTLEGSMKFAFEAVLEALLLDRGDQGGRPGVLLPVLLPLAEELDPDTYGGRDAARRRGRVHHQPWVLFGQGDLQRGPGRPHAVTEGLVDQVSCGRRSRRRPRPPQPAASQRVSARIAAADRSARSGI